MNTVLFTYRRQAQPIGGEPVTNINFINPFHIISMFWETTETGRRLNVFLVNGKPIIFPETIGKKLVNHVEDALRLTVTHNGGSNAPQNNNSQRRQAREPIAAEIVEEDLTGEEAAFV